MSPRMQWHDEGPAATKRTLMSCTWPAEAAAAVWYQQKVTQPGNWHLQALELVGDVEIGILESPLLLCLWRTAGVSSQQH